MATVYYTTDEEYPSYTVSEEPHSSLTPVLVSEEGLEVVRTYNEAERAYYAAKNALVKVLVPHCPECDHPQHRHQEWSKGWETWGCLVKVPTPEGAEFSTRTCRCQHGKPEGR